MYSGQNGALLHSFLSSASNDINFGVSVGAAGELNQDGYADVFVNARDGGYQRGSPGSARAYSGLDGSTPHSFVGQSNGDAFGRSISAAGDVNGDGRPDLILGAAGDDENGSASGSARVVPCCDFLGASYCSPAAPNSTGTPGILSIEVDLTNIPSLGAVLPGSTWYFQCLYRDSNPSATVNLTDAIEVAFD